MAAETTTSGSSSREAGVIARYRYCVYGIIIVSDTPLALPEYSDGGLGQVEFRSGPATDFHTATYGAEFDPQSNSWYQCAFLRDGSNYVRWHGVGEFLVSTDGRRITCRRQESASLESFQVYLLGQALSFALVKQGFEPLHATVAVVDDQAVAFLGNNAFGKSTLTACFLQAGHRLLTDDLLILQQSSSRILAYPGPPRIKLFPKIANRFLGHTPSRETMNAGTDKLILPLNEQQRCDRPITLKAIYSLAGPADVCRRPTVGIETLTPREAFVQLLRSTFNRYLVSSQRLERQFSVMTGLAGLMPVKKLSYPRAITGLEAVREMVIADLTRDGIDGGARWRSHLQSA